MKPNRKLVSILFLLLALFVLAGCSPAVNINSDGLVVGQSYRLRSGETLDNDLTVVGGTAELEADSVVNGDVAIIGGSLSVNGEVSGDVSAMGGVVSLGDTAVVHGNVQSLGATVSRSENATIDGTIGTGRPTINLPGSGRSRIEDGVSFIWSLIAPIFQAFALAALAVLVSLFALRPMERVGDAMTGHTFLAGGIGLLSAVVLPVLLIIISITVILLPVGLLGLLILALAVIFGWISAGLVTGERIAQALKQTWSGPVAAGVGSLVLSLTTSLIGAIACIGWIAPFLISVIGLGGVVLTRFGYQPYPPVVRKEIVSEEPGESSPEI